MALTLASVMSDDTEVKKRTWKEKYLILTYVYSQWRDDNISHDDTDIIDHCNLADSDLMSIAQESSMRSLLGGENQAAKFLLADLEKHKKLKNLPCSRQW